VVAGALVIIFGILFLDETVRLLCTNNDLQPLVKAYVRVVLWTASRLQFEIKSKQGG